MLNSKHLQILVRICCAITIPLATIIHVSLNNYKPGVHVINTFVDNMIPFNKFFAVPYLLMFAYITISLVYFAVVDGRHYFGLLASVLSGMFICFIIYYYFPTTVLRPKIIGNDIFTKMVANIYASDNPYNCFPSIHVLSSYLPFLFAFKFKKSTAMKIFTAVGFVIITLSTFFIKQHYVLDAVASILIGTVLFLVFSNEYVWSKIPYKVVIEFFTMPKLKKDVDS